MGVLKVWDSVSSGWVEVAQGPAGAGQKGVDSRPWNLAVQATEAFVVDALVQDVGWYDTVTLEAMGTILNDSGGAKVYTISVDLGTGTTLKLEFVTPSIASHATNRWPWHLIAAFSQAETGPRHTHVARMDMAAAGSADQAGETFGATGLHVMKWAANTDAPLYTPVAVKLGCRSSALAGAFEMVMGRIRHSDWDGVETP